MDPGGIGGCTTAFTPSLGAGRREQMGMGKQTLNQKWKRLPLGTPPVNGLGCSWLSVTLPTPKSTEGGFKAEAVDLKTQGEHNHHNYPRKGRHCATGLRILSQRFFCIR